MIDLSSHNVAHGGVIALLVDSTMGYAVFTVLKHRQLTSTLEFKINYFRPVMAGQVMISYHCSFVYKFLYFLILIFIFIFIFTFTSTFLLKLNYYILVKHM